MWKFSCVWYHWVQHTELFHTICVYGRLSRVLGLMFSIGSDLTAFLL